MTTFLSAAQFARLRKLSVQRVRQLLATSRIPIPANVEVQRSARACESALAHAGIKSLVVGSVAYGDIRPASDLDLLVVSYHGRGWDEASAIAKEAARPFGIPVDVIFADTLPRAIQHAMLKDACAVPATFER